MKYNATVTVTVEVALKDVEVNSFEDLQEAATGKVYKYLNMSSDRSDYSHVEEVTNVRLDDWDQQDD